MMEELDHRSEGLSHVSGTSFDFGHFLVVKNNFRVYVSIWCLGLGHVCVSGRHGPFVLCF